MSLFVEPIVEVVAVTRFESITPLSGIHTFKANLILELQLQEHWDRKPDWTKRKIYKSRPD
jgi:hypothetical protein